MNTETHRNQSCLQKFSQEAQDQAQTWMLAVQGLALASALDKRTEEHAHLAVLAAARMENGVPYHVHCAKEAGATREEVTSAILVWLPAVSQVVIQALPAALAAYYAS